jgi:hypothetical protein
MHSFRRSIGFVNKASLEIIPWVIESQAAQRASHSEMLGTGLTAYFSGVRGNVKGGMMTMCIPWKTSAKGRNANIAQCSSNSKDKRTTYYSLKGLGREKQQKRHTSRR